jgi:hypothetical protein
VSQPPLQQEMHDAIRAAEVAFDASSREDATRRNGTARLIGGDGLAVANYMAALGVAAGVPDSSSEGGGNARLFLVLALVAMIATAAVLIALGLTERLGRTSGPPPGRRCSPPRTSGHSWPN